jgi:uncharacterized membrane protein YfcA
MVWGRAGALLVGMAVGFLGGLFGKGGSAVATPLLSLIGFPGFVAIASPLPATVPGTLIASAEYWQAHLLDWEVIWWSIGVGFPATVVGSFLTGATGSRPLLILTALMVLAFGMVFLLKPSEKGQPEANVERTRPSFWKFRLVGIALLIGLISGLLANSGGFLLAPAYARILKMPLKTSFACSLAVASVLAVPGTIVHAYLGHISWTVTGIMALGSVPFSLLGAKVAIRTRASRLERWYGVALTVLGLFFLWHV